MAKKKSKRHHQKPAVRIEGVLESVADELAAVIDVLRVVPEMSSNGSDEIVEWAKVLKVKLEGNPGGVETQSASAPAAAARIAAWRLDRVCQVLEGLRSRMSGAAPLA